MIFISTGASHTTMDMINAIISYVTKQNNSKLSLGIMGIKILNKAAYLLVSLEKQPQVSYKRKWFLWSRHLHLSTYHRNWVHLFKLDHISLHARCPRNTNYILLIRGLELQPKLLFQHNLNKRTFVVALC